MSQMRTKAGLCSASDGKSEPWNMTVWGGRVLKKRVKSRSYREISRLGFYLKRVMSRTLIVTLLRRDFRRLLMRAAKSWSCRSLIWRGFHMRIFVCLRKIRTCPLRKLFRKEVWARKSYFLQVLQTVWFSETVTNRSKIWIRLSAKRRP